MKNFFCFFIFCSSFFFITAGTVHKLWHLLLYLLYQWSIKSSIKVKHKHLNSPVLLSRALFIIPPSLFVLINGSLLLLLLSPKKEKKINHNLIQKGKFYSHLEDLSKWMIVINGPDKRIFQEKKMEKEGKRATEKFP